ncbi:putative phage abortive infection protein [Pseudomonas sp. Tri1]|uniref:putative phage abortive infection protein n=1 Tax=Pseudomonas sp. Tri1 TaxID=2823875 RepID=UPI001B337160|nr:putative phage abortive infection protein [Pseudomonas sp. Tri1]
MKDFAPIAIAIAIVGVVNLGYLWKFGWGFSGSTTAWGEYGDFVGGLLNPIAAMASVYFIYITLKRQSDDARRNNISIKKNLAISSRSINSQENQIAIASRQLRDSQAYKLIELYRSMADRFVTKDGELRGAAAFALMRADALRGLEPFLARGQSVVTQSFNTAYMDTANDYFSGEQKHIQQFVRSTIKIIESIDKLQHLNDEEDTYIELLKTQVTQDELFALLFWYISDQSDPDFRNTVRTHKILEEHVSDIPRTSAIKLARAVDHVREMGGGQI